MYDNMLLWEAWTISSWEISAWYFIPVTKNRSLDTWGWFNRHLDFWFGLPTWTYARIVFFSDWDSDFKIPRTFIFCFLTILPIKSWYYIREKILGLLRKLLGFWIPAKYVVKNVITTFFTANILFIWATLKVLQCLRTEEPGRPEVKAVDVEEP